MQLYNHHSRLTDWTDLCLEYVQAQETLCTSQADDLKFDIEGTFTDSPAVKRLRVWLSRCGVEDGEPFNHKITTEVYIVLRNGNSGWAEWNVYEGTYCNYDREE